MLGRFVRNTLPSGTARRAMDGGFSPVGRVTGELSSRVEVLESVPLFSALLKAQLEQLAACLKTREAEVGEEVVREGERGETMYIVESGALEASVKDVGVVMKYGAGAFFGELALVNDEPRKATITATEDSVLLELTRADVTPLASVSTLAQSASCLRCVRHAQDRAFSDSLLVVTVRAAPRRAGGHPEVLHGRGPVRSHKQCIPLPALDCLSLKACLCFQGSDGDDLQTDGSERGRTPRPEGAAHAPLRAGDRGAVFTLSTE